MDILIERQAAMRKKWTRKTKLMRSKFVRTKKIRKPKVDLPRACEVAAQLTSNPVLREHLQIAGKFCGVFTSCSVKISVEEIIGLPPEQAEAFMSGVAKVLQAMKD